MDIQQLQNSLTGLQQPQQQFFNPQQQTPQPGNTPIPAQSGLQTGLNLEGNVLRIPLLFTLNGVNVKCFIEHKLSTGTLQEAYSVLQSYVNAGWPIDGWQPRQEQGQYQQQPQQYGQQGGYQQRQGYNNGYNRGGYRSNYRRY